MRVSTYFTISLILNLLLFAKTQGNKSWEYQKYVYFKFYKRNFKNINIFAKNAQEKESVFQILNEISETQTRLINMNIHINISNSISTSVSISVSEIHLFYDLIIMFSWRLLFIVFIFKINIIRIEDNTAREMTYSFINWRHKFHSNKYQQFIAFTNVSLVLHNHICSQSLRL